MHDRLHVRERAVLDDGIPLVVLDVVVRAEAEVGVLLLGRGVDPAPLVAAEGPFLVVAGDDVLPQLRADLLEQVAQVAHDGEVVPDGVLLLGQVTRGDGGQGGGGDGQGGGPLHTRSVPQDGAGRPRNHR
ncbi:hypothetical protein [Ornithinimicrobium kibberense]|uniref:hypothetical protein n=1 Tax=Ornithinimicrobium kibberense TaxID=282060 RepID=UPI00360C77B1